MSDELAAGPALDALVAEKVLGWEYHPDNAVFTWWQAPNDSWHDAPPPYSTDIAAAWQVVETMVDVDGPYGAYKWSFGMEYSSVIDWVVDFTPRKGHPQARNYPAFQASSTSPAEAICKAALAAVQSEAAP